MEKKINLYLQILNPCFMQVINNSHKHIGHKDSNKGGHYELLIVSNFFENKSKIDRHRIVNNILKNLFQNGIHALNIIAFSQTEWNKNNLKFMEKQYNE